ncbi:MAG: hypothetical protein ABI862_05275 [Ilumatobacteraceae bacterium]
MSDPTCERSDRLDWALLLPASVELPFDEVLVLGGTDRRGQSLVDHGLAAAWRRPTGPADRGSFVVAWEDCPVDVERIAGHVGAGGLLYLEIDRRRPGRRRLGPRSLRRALARSGRFIFSAHLVTPDLDRPSRYLPIDHPRAIRWHLRSLFIAGTPITRAVQCCLSAVLATPLAGVALRLVSVRYMVIATQADDQSSPLGDPMGRGGERAVLVTSGYDQASRAVVLPFQRGGRVPRFAVKVASSSTTTIGTQREHERLISLHASLPAHTARAVPTPIGIFALADRTACVQSYAPGPSMSATVGGWGRTLSAKCRDLDVVVDWLTKFAAETRVIGVTAERDWTVIFGEATAAIDFPPEVVDFLVEAEKTASAMALGDSAVHQHYDAGPWNVHLDGAEPMLIDWETDDLRPTDCLGPPLADVLYLVTYWYFLASRAESEDDEEAAIVRLFAPLVPADAAVVAARAAIDAALVGLGVERQAVPALLAALWAERAVYTRRRRADLGFPMETGRSRPEAYLRALAGAMPTMCAPDGWWALALGTQPR